MSPYTIPFALIAFLGFVAVAPIWMYWTGSTSGLPVEVQFLAALSFPALVALFLSSWINPGGA